VEAYLDPRNLIIANKAEEGSCEYFNKMTFGINNQLITVDQQKGEFEYLKDDKIIDISLGSDSLSELPNWLLIHFIIIFSQNILIRNSK
jgi:hypothetical protein